MRNVLSKIGLLIAVAVTVVASGCSGGPGAPGGASKGTEKPAMSTAREAYTLAERVAQKWKMDAELRSVRATWQSPTQGQLREGKVAWAFYFASKSSKSGNRVAGYIVSVSEKEAKVVREEPAGATTKPIVFVDWKVDSAQALRAFLDNGGADFLASHAAADVHSILHNAEGTESLVWEITALDRETKAMIGLRIDAASGKTVPIPQAKR